MTDVQSGLVIVDKPAGWTSHDVVGRMRRLAGTKKVGHAGTLDPMATGVLVLGINRATRLLGYLTHADKEYLATIRLGQSTVTDDAEGEVTATTPAGHIDEAAVRAAVEAYTGDIQQVPSSVSAIKVDGVRSYAAVRAGEEVTLKARPVTISTFDVDAVRVDGDVVDVDVRVVCSSGTYIRALARDIGADLGVGGHLTMLRRTRVGGFPLRLARTLEELEQELHVISLDDVARASFDSYDLPEREAQDVRFGRALTGIDLGAPRAVAMFDPSGQFLALYEQRGGVAKPVAVFV
ncbi:tRNA pseudouridine(55) synthase TruB [Aeromicrobium wangtongii]|uniref:tRNA pseudouridine synthase B n=1 Tax=Aeromicrobium wangtongii TaxID=2969247 RepID=A0ABY5M2P0_9ACTN|nr:tRNA pseudouridine(55) synthase TruB [Aeromicrobium wangtongii]MCD9198436.1 tRNA pseudouridine(55) synthase TruB [Aeromicrobium wangtongii]UUP12465.1 tRNA pseudouridine(55) synthase TruB [Aeromicrobium wangtongii]